MPTDMEIKDEFIYTGAAAVLVAFWKLLKRFINKFLNDGERCGDKLEKLSARVDALQESHAKELKGLYQLISELHGKSCAVAGCRHRAPVDIDITGNTDEH